MKILSKTDIFEKLNKIETQTGEDVSVLIKETANSPTVPYSVLVFINKHTPLEQLETYNQIYKRRRKNPLYKNLVNENLPIEDRAIALSSLLTQSLIRMKTLTESDRREYAEIMNISMISEALCDYSIYGNIDRLNNTFMMVRDVFKNLYVK